MYSKNIIERFWSKVAVSGENECWEWQASKDGCGYGKFATKSTTWERAHRFAYYVTRGDVPKGLKVCHSCDNPSCCNPSHLWLGTHQDNMTDMAVKKRSWGTRLNEEDVRAIREMSSNGYTQEELGDVFGVSHTHVHRIIHRINWKHI